MSDETGTAGQVEVKGGVAPYLTVDGVAKASAFYQAAFGAREMAFLPAGTDGRSMHCHLYINGGSLMLSDPFPEHGHPWVPPAGFNLHLQVDDIHAWFDRAVAAGAEVVTPIEQMFWGDFYAQLRDPFGVLWALGQTPKA